MNNTFEVEENGKTVTYEIIKMCRYKDNTYIIYNKWLYIEMKNF